ncbi:alpha/beta hydrolase [Thaumasiovibrio sp. DFM-14]|uniref:alpha/beta hydrolase n=1 Tax=Thaumasiovibrio sp. DFM-14 TaxID=3384792 RepID=UPI0039A2434C
MNKMLVTPLLLAAAVSAGVHANQHHVGSAFTASVDVPYGTGLVTVDGEVVPRELLMDLVQPKEPIAEQNPVVVMMFGGNFIRGARDFVYDVNGAQTTTMREYCERFAQEGYTCAAIDYRLSLEEPVSSNVGDINSKFIDDLPNFEPVNDRNNWIRGMMGLEPRPLEDKVMPNAIKAAAEDLYTAVVHLRDNAEEYGIDPDRVALGGFSAGGFSSLNVAFGLGLPVQAVISNSGVPLGFDIAKEIEGRSDLPPVLFNFGQFDEAPLLWGASIEIEQFNEMGIDTNVAWVPNYGHFYPAGATTLGEGLKREAVVQRMINFLNETL